jgi:hypothetical protein
MRCRPVIWYNVSPISLVAMVMAGKQRFCRLARGDRRRSGKPIAGEIYAGQMGAGRIG